MIAAHHRLAIRRKTWIRSRHSAVLVVFVVALATLLSTPPARCQGLFGVASGEQTEPSGALIEREQAVTTATEAFERVTTSQVEAALGRLDDESQRAAARSRFETVTSEIHGELESSIRDELDDLAGDGVLDNREVTDALRDIFDGRVDELEEALIAIVGGHDPPPRLKKVGQSAYPRALLHYAVFERNAPFDWLLFVACIAAGLFVAWLGSKAIRWSADRQEAREHDWRRGLLQAARGPFYLFALSLALDAGMRQLWIPGMADDTIRRSIGLLWTLAAFWYAWNATIVAAHVLAWTMRKTYGRHADRHLVTIFARVLRIGVLIAFSVAAINVVLDTSLAGMIAGLGIIGLALTLVLRGTIENIIASFTIFADKPFRVGDLLVYDGRLGTAEDIGFRSTKVRTLDGFLITVPNAKLIDDAITNIEARPWIRRRFRLDLPYATPPAKVEEALQILRDLLDGQETTPNGKPPHVVLEDFGASTLRVMVEYHHEPPDFWQALAFDTEINLAILRRFEAAEIELAFPTETTILTTAEDAPPTFRLEGPAIDLDPNEDEGDDKNRTVDRG